MLNTVEKALSAYRQSFPSSPEGLYEPIDYVLSMGGKRLRPVLCLMAYALYKEDVERAIPAALALCTYHNHTLLHDDLMDNADVRRGKATVHKVWDANTAVLSGDTMLIMACQKMMETDSAHLVQLMNLFLRTQQEICEGQQYDINFEKRTDVTVEEYIEMIRLKTSVLLACALKCGAIVAEASAADADILYHFGEKVGLAFQLQDDYLDCYGNPEVFGKAIGGDIRQGKKTFMQITALQHANEEEKRQILDVRDVPTVLAIYDKYEVPQTARRLMDDYYAEARTLWESLSVVDEKKAGLWDYAASMLKREV